MNNTSLPLQQIEENVQHNQYLNSILRNSTQSSHSPDTNMNPKEISEKKLSSLGIIYPKMVYPS